jgi:acetyl esterase/lipase
VLTVPSRILPFLIRATGRNRTLSSAREARNHIEELRIRPRPFGPPRRLRPDVTVGVEHRAGWPIYTLAPANCPPSGAFVYVHGGGWVNEIEPPHWQLAAQVAAAARMRVTVPIYPLIPFATAVEVVPTIVDIVLEQSAAGGAVALGGDSAGGQIALSAALLLRDEHSATVAHTILIAPVLDLALNNPAIDDVEPRDPWLSRTGIRVYGDHWRGELSLTDPRVSPLTADLAGLGPLTIFSGTRDLLNPDARLLVRKATSAGVDVDYYEEPGLVHVYPLTPTPQGRAARRAIVGILRQAPHAESPTTRHH